MHFADFHCDTAGVLFEQKDKAETLLHNNLQIDAGRLYTSGCVLQHFALFIDMKKYDAPYRAALAMLDYYDAQTALCKDFLMPVKRPGDIPAALSQNKIAAIVTVEEGGILENDLTRLDTLYKRGVRLLTLTWNYENCIGSPSNLYYGQDVFPTVPNTARGLTAFGQEVIARCEELGIVVDVSHLSDKGFYDVYDMCTRPFVASHSSARSICPHVRNATDDMIRKLAEKGGLIGVNFCPAFIEPCCALSPYGTIESTVRHIRHIYNTGGISCLSIGSDFDGIQRHLELDDVSCMPLLFEALKKDGFTEDEIDAILFKNMLQFYSA